MISRCPWVFFLFFACLHVYMTHQNYDWQMCCLFPLLQCTVRTSKCASIEGYRELPMKWCSISVYYSWLAGCKLHVYIYIYTHKNLGAVQCRSVKTSFSLLQRLQRHLKPTCLCEFGCFSLIHFSLLWVNWVWLSNLGFFSAYNTDETCLLTFVILWAWLVGVWKSTEETCPCFLAHRKCKEEKQCFWTLHLLL